MESIELIISGRVQGVGFRHFAANQARALHIQGFIKNLYDGRIEIIAQGEKDALELFICQLNNGPRLAHVCDIEQSIFVGKENFTDFSVRF